MSVAKGLGAEINATSFFLTLAIFLKFNELSRQNEAWVVLILSTAVKWATQILNI